MPHNTDSAAWDASNTNGFSETELQMLNNVQQRLEHSYPGIDPKNIHDLMNNDWYEGITENALFAAVAGALDGESARA